MTTVMERLAESAAAREAAHPVTCACKGSGRVPVAQFSSGTELCRAVPPSCRCDPAGGFTNSECAGCGQYHCNNARAHPCIGGTGVTFPLRADDEDTARLINGLVEAGDLLMLHVQRIDWDPRAANLARECWLESRAVLSGDHGQKRWPDDARAAFRNEESET